MSIKPKNELSPKHLQALDLINAGQLSYREIAKQVGFTEDHLYSLIAGDSAKCGSAASLFAAEVDTIMAQRTKEIRHLTKTTQKNLLCVFQEYSELLKTKGHATPKQLSTAVAITNALAKSTPNVEIGSFSYTKGLSAEDLVNEFRRLKGIATDRLRVRGLEQDGSGEIPGSEEPGSPS